MKILLIGKYGQLGWELQRSLALLGELTVVDYPEIDLADADGPRRLVRATKPDLIINSAAYTAVDNAESESQICHAINAVAPGILAEEACALKAAIIHYSTDYVFDGAKTTPYVETDQPNPINTYGVSKLEGDLAVQKAGCASIILRTSWVYSTRDRGFVSKVLQWSRQQNVMRVVVDQIASPTWCRMLADATAQMVSMGVKDIFSFIEEHHGLYHVAGGGSASRWEWARAILDLDPHKEEQLTAGLEKAFTSEYPDAACRPANSALDCSCFERTFGLKLPDWRTALKLAMEAA